MKKKRVLYLVLLLLLPAVIALGTGGSEAAKTEEARTVMKVAVNNFPARWDPATRFSNNSMKIHCNLHDGLVRYPAYGSDLTPQPMVAESWTKISPTVTEFRIREGVKFWDGSTVTAEDVAWSINRSIRGDHPRYKSYAYGRVLYNFENVEIVDEMTVRIHTVNPEPLLFGLLSQTPAAILSKKAFDATGGDFAAFMRNPVGCGPYKIKEFRDDEYIKLERFEDYWGDPAPLDELHYYFVPEVAARITALVNGEVDFIDTVPPDQISALEGRDGIRIVANNPLLFHVYQLNTNRYPLSDQRIRMAFNLAVDRDLLNRTLWAGKGVVPSAFQHPSTPGYDPEWKLWEYNPERARQLVKEADYDGTPIELNLEKGYYLYSEHAAAAVVKMLEDVGLNAQFRVWEDVPSSSTAPPDPEGYLMSRAWSNTASLPFELIGCIPDWAPTDWPATTGLTREWAPEDHQVLPKGKYRDKYVDLYEKARYATGDLAERTEKFHDFVEHIHYDVTPWVILYTPLEYYAMDDDIEWEVPPNYHPYTYPFRAGEVDFR